MLKNKIEELREKLNLLIVEESDYSKILEASRELDEYIVKYMLFKKLYLDQKNYI